MQELDYFFVGHTGRGSAAVAPERKLQSHLT